MTKLPAIQFYPADWRKDAGVQSLSFEHRGIWFEMLCLMHESGQRGKLMLNGRAMTEDELGRVLGLDKQNLTTALTCIQHGGVSSVDPSTGAIMCRRMVRDEELRKIRTEAGKRGGNPALLNQKTTTEVKQKTTPSSSSSSSSSDNGVASPELEIKAKIAGSPFHQAFIKGWHENFKEKFSIDYKMDGGRDGKAVKALLKLGIHITDLLEIAKQAWDRPSNWDCKQATTINGFENRFNPIHVQVKTTEVNGNPKEETVGGRF